MLVKEVSSDFIEIHAPAKINLFLQVLGRRPDGFHDISSLMQVITLFDILKIKKIEDPKCRVTVSGELSSTPIKNNLIIRAYELLNEKFGLKSGIEVGLDKNIPIAAGLGGGSSDCAAAMAAINLIFELRLSNSELAGLSMKLGSDIPFFFSRGQALVTGRGEIIEETEYEVDYNIVVVSSGIPVSTAQSYQDLNLNLTKIRSACRLEPCCGLEGYFELLSKIENDFEAMQFRHSPKLLAIKEELLRSGAKIAKMSGSGPAMFGLYLNNSEVGRVNRDNFPGCQLHTVKPFLLPRQEMSQL